MIIYFATTNTDKAREIDRFTSKYGINVKYHDKYRSLNVQETGKSFSENASIKAAALSRELGNSYVIADDSGLCINSLDGKPGIYSARFMKETPEGVNPNQYLLNIMQQKKDRQAYYACSIALAYNGDIIEVFEDKCIGDISLKLGPDGGFGFDPIFILPDGRYMSELTIEEKNAISHRGRALMKLIDFLRNLKNQLI